MKRFTDKVALITGASSGIGRETALAFAREGAKVVIGNRREKEGKDVVAEISAAGGDALFVRTDVAKDEEVKALVDAAVETFGGLHIAFNNAGVEGDMNLMATQSSDENYRRVFDVNVKGVLSSMKYEIQHMIENGGGSIVNTGSIAGIVGLPTMGIYVASKHAVMGLTKSAAVEFAAQGVRINAVNPAVIETDMSDRFLSANEAGKDAAAEFFKTLHPIGRFGQPAEVASVVLWLSSDDASYVHGQGINVDGAFTSM